MCRFEKPTIQENLSARPVHPFAMPASPALRPGLRSQCGTLCDYLAARIRSAGLFFRIFSSLPEISLSDLFYSSR